MPCFAITGGTGFVGRHTLDAALLQGATVRALTRHPQAPRAGVTWVEGSLEDTGALAELVAGADAVIHIAGVTNARNAAGFEAGNVTGTARMRAAAAGLPFVHVSSLAARAPDLSLYCASKHRAEAAARDGRGPFTMVRPPAVYGPGDRELLLLFRAARLGLVAVPAGTRASMIHVRDLARALVALACDLPGAGKSAGQVLEIDDGHGGYSQKDIGRQAAIAVGRRALVAGVPAAVLKLGAAVDTGLARLAGRLPRLSFDRARYLVHPDWTADVRPLLSLGLWRPEIALAPGMAETAQWYAREGWL